MEHAGSKETPPLPIKAAVVTISDSCSRGEREDMSGPAAAARLAEGGFEVETPLVIPDDREIISATLAELCDGGDYALVITTGGTGLSPRDTTPEATRDILEKEVPGIGELLRSEGYRIKPSAILSRGISGLRNGTLIVNLPGSIRGVSEGLDILMPILPHALEVASGRAYRCGG